MLNNLETLRHFEILNFIKHFRNHSITTWTWFCFWKSQSHINFAKKYQFFATGYYINWQNVIFFKIWAWDYFFLICTLFSIQLMNVLRKTFEGDIFLAFYLHQIATCTSIQNLKLGLCFLTRDFDESSWFS